MLGTKKLQKETPGAYKMVRDIANSSGQFPDAYLIFPKMLDEFVGTRRFPA
jgi:hypothetical protein